MTLADVPLPSGLRLIVDCLIEAVWSGVRGFRAGGTFANAPPGLSLPLLHRLARILRFAFLIAACWLELKPARRILRRHMRARGPAVRCVSFAVFPRSRPIFLPETPQPQPSHFAAAVRDPVLTLQRGRDALLHALLHPLAHIRRVARRLPTQLRVFSWFPPKRPPPLARRAFWDEERDGFCEARFQVREYHRRRNDSLPAGAFAS